MPNPRLPAVEQGLVGVTSPKEADAGAVGLVPPGTDVADATSAATAMSRALADLGGASDDSIPEDEADAEDDDAASGGRIDHDAPG